MNTDFLIRLSQALRESPYDIKIEVFHGDQNGKEASTLVELHTKDGRFWGSGESPTSFVNAFTKAEKELKAQRDEAIYADTINDFLMGTGRL